MTNRLQSQAWTRFSITFPANLRKMVALHPEIGEHSPILVDSRLEFGPDTMFEGSHFWDSK